MRKVFALFVVTLLSETMFAQSKSLDEFVDRYVEQNNFSGTILIQHQSEIVFDESFGLANLEFTIPNSIDTKYKIASITKLFTSVLIMQLVEDGKVDLINQPVVINVSR